MAEEKKSRLGLWIAVILGAAGVAGVGTGIYFYKSDKPQVEVEEVSIAARPSLVETVTARKSNEPVDVVAYGIVQPNRSLSLQSEVSGRVIEMSDNLDAGGLLKEGEIMLKIDPRNYVTEVEQEKANVERAEFELQVEKGKQMIAKREWELLDPQVKTSDVGKQLALRIPHVRQKEAALDAAKSKLEKAMLNLKKTILITPFDSMVIEEFVEAGQLISAQAKVATLISTDEFRVQVSIPYDQLSWIQIPKHEGGKASAVTVTQDLGDGQTIERQGKILRLLGSLDPNGRMARLLVIIDDPLGINSEEFSSSPLLIGTNVKISIEGPKLENAFVLPRSALRGEKHVWVMNEENRLEVRNVEVASRDKENVVITKGLQIGDKVITGSLPSAVPGMELRSISSIVPEERNTVQ